MSKEEDYRSHAADSLELASRAGSNPDKLRLLAMAEAWLDLADRAHRLMRQHASKLKEHPLLTAKLGGGEKEAE